MKGKDMNRRSYKPMLLLLTALLTLHADLAATLEQLNGLMTKYSMTQVKLELKPDGTVIRRDGNGYSAKFNLKDIREFNTDFDGVVGNLLLTCDPQKKCVAYELEGGVKKGNSGFTVISINPGEKMQEIIALFKRLQEELQK